jgi:hypothetical protein
MLYDCITLVDGMTRMVDWQPQARMFEYFSIVHAGSAVVDRFCAGHSDIKNQPTAIISKYK